MADIQGTGTSSTQQHFCGSCGAEVADAKFCRQCGQPVDALTAATTQQAPVMAPPPPVAAPPSPMTQPLASAWGPPPPPVAPPTGMVPAIPPPPSRSNSKLPWIAGALAALVVIGVIAVIVLASSGGNSATATYRQSLATDLGPLVSANSNLASTLQSISGTDDTSQKAAAAQAQSALSTAQSAVGGLSVPSGAQQISQQTQQALDDENGYLQAVAALLGTPTQNEAVPASAAGDEHSERAGAAQRGRRRGVRLDLRGQPACLLGAGPGSGRPAPAQPGAAEPDQPGGERGPPRGLQRRVVILRIVQHSMWKRRRQRARHLVPVRAQRADRVAKRARFEQRGRGVLARDPAVLLDDLWPVRQRPDHLRRREQRIGHVPRLSRIRVARCASSG